MALPEIDLGVPPPTGWRDRWRVLGVDSFSQWVRAQPQVLVTDTTMRDAPQSLFATRMRSADMLAIAPYYARMLPEMFSLECWGGAAFDVALRSIKEDPWESLSLLRERMPNILFQMLLCSSNGGGGTNHADNVIDYFVQQAAKGGIDLFRVFDSLNRVGHMRVAIDAVRENGALCEAAICYTGDLFDPVRSAFSLQYYIKMAKELERAGVNILAVKDVAGVCAPRAAFALVKALREETGLPVHFDTRATSGVASASVLAAIAAGCDVVDGSMDAMLGSLVAALAGEINDPKLDRNAINTLSQYWEYKQINSRSST